MANWTLPKCPQELNLKGFDENDLIMGIMLSQKPTNDLIQNCDLPPPTKVFSGFSENATIMQHKVYDYHVTDDDDEIKKLGLLKALRLSQTRAREAEAKCSAIAKERDSLAVAVLQDSLQIFAYRQLVNLLQLQVLQLQQQSGGKGKKENEDEMEDDDDDDVGSDCLTWMLTMAVCLAGVGFAFGCKYIFRS